MPVFTNMKQMINVMANLVDTSNQLDCKNVCYNKVCRKGLFIYEISHFGRRGGGQPNSDILLTKKLIQNCTLDERKNEGNGSNHEETEEFKF